MGSLSEDELIQKAIDGEVEAFGELVKKYQKRIYSLIYQMTFSHEDANDLSQETFFRAYKSLSKFKKESSFYTWLYRIAVNLVLNHLKKRKNERKNLSFDIHYLDSPQKILEKKEFYKKLKEVISMLPLSQRITLNLVVNHGLSHKEIAKIQGCSEGTISWRIFQARRFLREKLEPYLREK
jgi:RNA polymerase sigma-70 factor (ECF subfamily)